MRHEPSIQPSESRRWPTAWAAARPTGPQNLVKNLVLITTGSTGSKIFEISAEIWIMGRFGLLMLIALVCASLPVEADDPPPQAVSGDAVRAASRLDQTPSASSGPGGGINAPLASSVEIVSCVCEQSACGPCEMETGTAFYSAKCGPANTKVKSCKKPTCVPVDNQPACLALLETNDAIRSKANAEAPVALAPAFVSPSAATPAIAEDSGKREPATPILAEGQILDVVGDVTLAKNDGNGVERRSVVRGTNLVKGHQLETGAFGKAKVSLPDGSEIFLPPNSRVRIETIDIDRKNDKRAVTIFLAKGRVRARVNKKYEGGNSFRILTRTAVAGVRGTEFVVSFDDQGPTDWITEVRTIEGRVQLSGPPAMDGAPAKDVVIVTKGTYAAHIMDRPPDEASDAQIVELARRGFLTPLFSMKEEEMRLLLESTDFDSIQARADQGARQPASSSAADPVCASPAGQFNQCSWTCEGNPKGERQ